MAAVRPKGAEVGLLLDLDPDLGASVDAEDWEIARRACRGTLVRAPAGRLLLPPDGEERDALFGLVILTGLLCREGRLRDRHLLELLGPGDVLQLPAPADGRALKSAVTFTAALETHMIAVGGAFIRAAGRWPGLLVSLTRRLEVQRERLAGQALITHLPRAEDRLLLMLWHLADRWGVVTPAGIVLRLPLSHDVLAQLIAARRPTASLALRALELGETVKRLPDGSWLLTPRARGAVETTAMTPELARSLGEMIAAQLRSSQTAEQARALRAEAKLARAASGHGGHPGRDRR